MQAIAAIDLLNFWERTMNHTQIQKAIYLLSLAYPELNTKEIASLSIGERDAKLLLLREWIFGSRLLNMAQCPICTEWIEWETDIHDIQQQLPGSSGPRGNYVLEENGYSIFFRLPNSNDITEIITSDVNTKTPIKLLGKLIIDCKFNNEPCNFDDLPEEVLKALDSRIEEESPQADIQMSIKCVNCSHQWEIQFDILYYFWNEIDNWARNLLHDAGTLAQAFGWSEQDILNLSPARRRIYLDLVNT
jgi:hypothetical protein